MAEGVAMQSVSLALQTLHGRRPTWAALAGKIDREVIVGLVRGQDPERLRPTVQGLCEAFPLP